MPDELVFGGTTKPDILERGYYEDCSQSSPSEFWGREGCDGRASARGDTEGGG
jgi:hypothetical protein